jgi:acetyltransferase-like isoleucine patch superfamily enzyme
MCGWALWHWKVRAILYRLIGISISKCSAIHSGCFLSGNHLMIGDNSYINRRCTIDCKHGNVLIGNNVGVAFDVKMYTTEHNYENPNKRTGFVSGADIIIKDGCWIGGAV